MDVKEEIAKALEQYKKEQAEKLRAKMSKFGRSRSPKKRRAVRKNIKLAQAARFGRPKPKT
jgi:hypothetical protein